MTDAHLREFLLRRLPADEAARLEDAILLETGFAERLRDAEFDLVDDYAASRLRAEDAAAVERYLLASADNLHALRVARALQGAGALEKPKRLLGVGNVDARSDVRAGRSRSTGRRSRTPQIAGVATLLAACLVAVVVMPRWRSVAHRAESVTTASDARIGPSPGGSGQTSNAGAALPIVSLVADVNRGAARSSLKITRGAPAVRLQVEVPEPSTDTGYTIRIDDAQGHRLFEGAGLAVRAAGPYRFVEAAVPAAALGPGDRTVSLTGSGARAGGSVTYRWEVTGVVDPTQNK